jgi:hypothetical protein
VRRIGPKETPPRQSGPNRISLLATHYSLFAAAALERKRREIEAAHSTGGKHDEFPKDSVPYFAGDSPEY